MLFGFCNDTFDGLTLFPARRQLEQREDLVKPIDLSFGFLPVRLQTSSIVLTVIWRSPVARGVGATPSTVPGSRVDHKPSAIVWHRWGSLFHGRLSVAAKVRKRTEVA